MHGFNVFFWSFFCCLVLAKPWSGTTAQTANGPIVGHRASNRSHVIEYLGIPYAEPPVGPWRFAAPQKYTTKKKVIASQFVSQSRQSMAHQILLLISSSQRMIEMLPAVTIHLLTCF